jgi:hypothetical protein
MTVPESLEGVGFAATPPWLRGPWATKLLTVVYGIFDVANQANREAAKLGLVAECADDAIDDHAEERMIERLPGETTAALRLRLVDAWRTWTTSGTTLGLRTILRTYLGAPTLEVYDFANDAWYDGAALTGFDDDERANWSRLALVVPQPHPWTRPVVGPGLIVGPDLLVGITMTGSELSRLRRAFRRYAPAHMVSIGLEVIMDATSAAAHLADHATTSDVVRMPVDTGMVGYAQHGMVVGPGLIVGYRYT